MCTYEYYWQIILTGNSDKCVLMNIIDKCVLMGINDKCVLMGLMTKVYLLVFALLSIHKETDPLAQLPRSP